MCLSMVGLVRYLLELSEILPATHFMRMIRGIVLRGAEVVDLWRDALWLLGFTCLGLLVASLRFKKSLD